MSQSNKPIVFDLGIDLFNLVSDCITCVMLLRALSPLEDPRATYVPHIPTAGLTAVGIRKDMGLFPGSMLLCYSYQGRLRTKTLEIAQGDGQVNSLGKYVNVNITGLCSDVCVLFGQEKARIWLFKRIPEEVSIPLPNGLFTELHKNRIKTLKCK
jgi:hypothetical protein